MLPISYTSAEQGAPVLNNAPGSLLSILKACLVSGFNNVGITSVSIAGNVATVVTNANHGLAVGHRVTVEGVSVTAANGVKTVATVPTAASFTFPCVNTDVSESPVSASIKRTPLGWVEQFSKTNVSIFKSGDPAAYGQSLRVDDTEATGLGARAVGVENPTSVDVWTDKFPNEVQMPGGLYWPKSPNSSAPIPWCVIGDERFFYLLIPPTYYYTGYYPNSAGGYAFTGVFFGDLVSNKPGESFGAIIGGCNLPGNQNTFITGMMRARPLGSSPTDHWSFVARQQSGVAKSIRIAVNHPGGRIPGDAAYPRYPSPVDNGMNIAEPSLVMEALTYANNPVRGVLPGFATFLCNHSDLPQSPFPQKLVTTDGSNREYLFAPYFCVEYPYDNSGCFAVKMSEAWR